MKQDKKEWEIEEIYIEQGLLDRPKIRERLRTILLGVVKHYSPNSLKGDYGRMDIPSISPSDALDLIEDIIDDK
jgi:hypothetical protein